MSTFQELQDRLVAAKNRKAILLRLIEYVDTNFCPVAGKEPEFKLLNDEKVPVPVDAFESTIADILSPEVQALDHEIAQIMGSALTEGGKKDETKKGKKAQGAVK